ncbi:Cinnamoyl-CoA reductase-like SNL6-like protein [Drosera capensis]
MTWEFRDQNKEEEERKTKTKRMDSCFKREVLMREVGYGEKQRRCIGEAFFSGLMARERKLVCVTSGNSLFGAHLIKELLIHGYFVRATVQNPGDLEDLKRLLSNEEMGQVESVVVAKMGDLDSLCEAFRGCHAVFHTSSFIDPHGVAGYTVMLLLALFDVQSESYYASPSSLNQVPFSRVASANHKLERMVFLETEAARNVVEACGRAAYIKRCVFTSSLLASIWTGGDSDQNIDESCWSDEDFCVENKLWLALGKTRAEKIAWSKANVMRVKLVTVCPGLIMAPSFPVARNETSLPYLKGGRIMFQRGTLATKDVDKLAKAHVQVYEDMDYGACGRYICFDRIVSTTEEAVQLENALKLHGLLSGDRNAEENDADAMIPARITNNKLNRLLCNAAQRLSCRR